MQASPEQKVVLEYRRSRASDPIAPWLLLPIGAVPFAIEVMAIIWEGVTGDPPNNLGEFKAYHYAVVSAAVMAAAWFLWVAYKFRNRHRWWVLLVCSGWSVWVFWVGFWFLRDLHRHPAGEYYWS